MEFLPAQGSLRLHELRPCLESQRLQGGAPASSSINARAGAATLAILGRGKGEQNGHRDISGGDSWMCWVESELWSLGGWCCAPKG
jgi:hypothetical protein